MKLTCKYSVSRLAKHLVFSPCFTEGVFILLKKIILKLLIVLGQLFCNFWVQKGNALVQKGS